MNRLIFIFIVVTLAAAQSSQANEFSYALKLYQDKFYDLAIKEFDSFAKKYPNSAQTADALFYLGLSYKQYKQNDQALQVFRRTAIDFPNYLKADEAWMEVGRILESQRKWGDAAVAYETVKLLYGKSALAAEALFRASHTYEKAGDLQKAMFGCRVILDEYQESSLYLKARLQLVRLLRIDGKLAEAKLELSKVGKQENIVNDIGFEEAQIQLAEHEFALAKKNLLAILSNNPRYENAHAVYFQLGEIEFRDANYQSALTYYEKSIHPETKELALERIADCYFLEDKFSEAAKKYAQANGVLAEFKHGLALEKSGQIEAALSVLSNINPAQPELRNELKDQLVLSKAKLLQKTNDQLTIVSLINTNLPLIQELSVQLELSVILGAVYEKRLENDLALGTYNRFLLSHPNYQRNDELLWRKGNLLERTGKQAEAIKVYQQLAQAFPISVYFDENEQKINQLGSSNLTSQNDVNKKLSQLLAELIENKNKGELYFSLGLLNFENLNDFPAAIQYFEKALTDLNEPHSRVDAYVYIAKSFMHLAQSESADSLFRRSFENYGAALKEKPDANQRFIASLGLIEAQLKLIRNEKDLNSRAIKYYEKLIDENKGALGLEHALLTVVTYYRAENRLSDAKVALKKIGRRSLQENAFLQLAELYSLEDSLLHAADYYREVLSNYPSSKRRYHVIKELANLEERLGRKENAILFLKMLVDQYPIIDHAKEKSAIIAYYLNQGKISEAELYLPSEEKRNRIDDIVLATEFQLESYELLLQFARLYDAKNDHAKAIYYYQDYVRLAPTSKEDDAVYHAIGQIYVEDERFDQAVSYFERIQKDYILYPKIEQSLAIIYFQNENYKEAATYSKRVMDRISPTDQAYETLNRNYLISLIKANGLTNFRTQLKSYQKNFPKDKEGHARILFEYAKEERKNKNFTSSNKLLDEIIDDYDNTSYVDDATYLMGLNYIIVNNFEKAMDIFTAFPDDFPSSSILDEYYNSLGTILEQFGKNDDAIEAYRKALTYSKSEKTKKLSYAKLISLFNKLGLSESVLSTASTFIQLYPTDAKAFEVKILIGQALSNMNRGTEAVSYFKQLKLEADSESEPEIQYWIANAYYKMGDYEAAISEYIKIPLLSKKTKLQWVPSALYYAGQSYEKLGKVEDAVRMYEKIVTTPGIDAVFKNDAKKRIKQLQGGRP